MYCGSRTLSCTPRLRPPLPRKRRKRVSHAPCATASNSCVESRYSKELAMFTWICPKCGSEVPPSENECPNCRAKAATAVAQDPQVSAAETLPPQVVPPPARTQAVEAPPRKAVSPTVVALGSALGMVALLAMLYMYVLPRGSAKS